MSDTKKAISVDSLQATTALIEQLRIEAEAIIASLNETGGVAPVWINTKTPPFSVGGFSNSAPATPADGLDFEDAMNKLLFPSVAPTIGITSPGGLPYLNANPTFSVSLYPFVNNEGATLESIYLLWKRADQNDVDFVPVLNQNQIVLNSSTSYSFQYANEVGENNTSNQHINFRVIVTDSTGATGTNNFTKEFLPYVAPSLTGYVSALGIVEVGTPIPDFTNVISVGNSGTLLKTVSKVIETNGAFTSGTTLLLNGNVPTFSANTVSADLAFAAKKSIAVKYVIKDIDTNGLERIVTLLGYSRSFLYRIFFGSHTGSTITDADIRALPNPVFENVTSITLNTGTVNKDFYVAVPSTKKITAAVNLDALGASVLADYEAGLQEGVSIPDAGGNATSYDVYKMTIANPYGTSQRHQITIGNK